MIMKHADDPILKRFQAALDATYGPSLTVAAERFRIISAL
jgi:hypothetical protein